MSGQLRFVRLILQALAVAAALELPFAVNPAESDITLLELLFLLRSFLVRYAQDVPFFVALMRGDLHQRLQPDRTIPALQLAHCL